MIDNFSLSRSPQNRLELSVKMGCGRMCSYCPQDAYIAQYKDLFGNTEKNLTIELVQEISSNVPSDTIISWSGFTEPLDCRDFGKISEHFKVRGMSQLISTTLHGHPKAKEYFLENLDNFNVGVTLHLPDSNGYMKGKFDSNYVVYVESVILRLFKKLDKQFYIFLIGDEFHANIIHLIEKYKDYIGSERIIKAKYLNTRSSSINTEKFQLNTTDIRRMDGLKYYCSYGRLNRGVMLPNGIVTICCQDYKLHGILGSLKDNSLDKIYRKIEEDQHMRHQFLNGSFVPCVNCEHYATIDSENSHSRIS